MNLPKDPLMLLSVINTKLRDHYQSLELLCEDLQVKSEEIEDKLRMVGYEYNEQLNRFV